MRTSGELRLPLHAALLRPGFALAFDRRLSVGSFPKYVAFSAGGRSAAEFRLNLALKSGLVDNGPLMRACADKSGFIVGVHPEGEDFAVGRTFMPGGVAATCETFTRVPTVVCPGASSVSMEAAAVPSMAAIIMGVA